MDAELRKVLSKLVLEIRHLLEGYYDESGVWHAGDLEQRLNQIGVWRDRPTKPLEELPQLSEANKKTRRTVDAYIKYREDTGVSQTEAVEEFIRESAYTWFNRLFALRCMEARGIIDEVVLQKDIYGGRSLQHNRLAIRHPELCVGEDDGLYTVLFQEFERKAHELPILFNPESPAIALKPSVSVVKKLIAILSGRENVNGDYSSDETFMAPDAFGWAYQYWNNEEKDRIFEDLRVKKIKISGKRIVPVTCLYTETYIVKFLVQNSLGAQWMCMHPKSRLSEKWAFFVEDIKRNPLQPKNIRNISFLDPACGSGHFLLEAFDLFYDMYGEEEKKSRPEKICASILENNLYGIDIDERAVQISRVVLWMKAKEKAPMLDASELSGFRDHLMSTNIRLPKGRDHLEEFLRKHPEDRPLKNALESIFDALENVDMIGSLLRIKEPLEQAFEKLRADAGIQTTLWNNGLTNVDSWFENVINQLKAHFNEEAVSAKLSNVFFGQSVQKGLTLINILSQKYDVVATNPPYLGIKHIGLKYKKYLENNYSIAKYDLFGAFIIRSIYLTRESGHIGLLTRQSWMYIKSFSQMRSNNSKVGFKGILNELRIECIVDLGSGAFREIAGEVVDICMFILHNIKRTIDNSFITYRLSDIDTYFEKENYLKEYIKNNIKENTFITNHDIIKKLPLTPISYWISADVCKLFDKQSLKELYLVRSGIITGNNDRFIRYINEIPINSKKYSYYVKAGGYCKWSGLRYYVINKEYDFIRLESFSETGGNNRPRTTYRHEYEKGGFTYSVISGGSFSLRILEDGELSDRASPFIYLKRRIKNYNKNKIFSMNSRLFTYLLRILTTGYQFSEHYVERIPLVSSLSKSYDDDFLYHVIDKCIFYKQKFNSFDLLEKRYDPNYILLDMYEIYNKKTLIETKLLTFEGIFEKIIFDNSSLNENSKIKIFKKMGYPAGLYAIVKRYDNFNILNDPEITDYIKSQMDNINHNELIIDKKLKNIIKEIYQNNNIKIDDEYDKLKFKYEDPLPSEFLIENISKLLQIHPISVYHILKEGIVRGKWRCLSEEKRFMEDRFTVVILRLMGHRWPKQVEAGEPIPDWADPNGIIPLSEGTGEKTLLIRIRERINEDFHIDSLTLEREFEKLMGKSLNEWLLSDFFKHHVSQFKKRPPLWQINSIPNGVSRKRKERKPAFSCIVYCQKIDEDTLHKIRSQYVGPLKNGYEAELRTLETIGQLNTEQIIRRTKLEMLINELEDFDHKLQGIINEGFDSNELRTMVNNERLDKWCSIDGEVPHPTNGEEFYLQERAYIPDINDGVRVNIAPLQKAGLLAEDVLSKKDLEKAITDRAEWRRDERRWCRQGKLPQPGWWSTIEEEE